MSNKVERISTPFDLETVKKLEAGDNIFLNGVIYTARDQVHKRLYSLIKKGKKLPFELRGQVIFYCGPTPRPLKKIIGSCGPTTSSRMDRFTPPLIRAGLKGMIGKGRRSEEVVRAIKKHKAVYFLAPAGCGAYLSKRVKNAEIIAYPDLGTEAMYRLEVENFPLIVGIDTKGRNIYQMKT